MTMWFSLGLVGVFAMVLSIYKLWGNPAFVVPYVVYCTVPALFILANILKFRKIRTLQKEGRLLLLHPHVSSLTKDFSPIRDKFDSWYGKLAALWDEKTEIGQCIRRNHARLRESGLTWTRLIGLMLVCISKNMGKAHKSRDV